jgi:hypothetical protein
MRRAGAGGQGTSIESRTTGSAAGCGEDDAIAGVRARVVANRAARHPEAVAAGGAGGLKCVPPASAADQRRVSIQGCPIHEEPGFIHPRDPPS